MEGSKIILLKALWTDLYFYLKGDIDEIELEREQVDALQEAIRIMENERNDIYE